MKTGSSPVVDSLAECVSNLIARSSDEIPVLLVSGAQGSGKSTAVNHLSDLNKFRIATLSVDDFYLTKEERRQLGQRVSPLFETRGPPGTHDVAMLKGCIKELQSSSEKSETVFPHFEKARDDRGTRDTWHKFSGRPDAIVVEGWLMGALPDLDSPNSRPINPIEELDTNGTWRSYQEEQLNTHYAELWDCADAFFHIDAPDFSVVMSWRLQQEASNLSISPDQLTDNDKSRIASFIQYYERITRRMLQGLKRAGTVAKLDDQRNVVEFTELIESAHL